MSWATGHIEKLQKGETIKFRPRGDSMSPVIKSGDLVEVVPVVSTDDVEVGDIVLCKVRGSHYLHFVKNKKGKQVQIGNNSGKIKGWKTKV